MHKGFAKLFNAFFVGLLVVALSQITHAQFRAAIQGTVTDSNGGTISGATVTLNNNETGRAQTATTNENGFYRFSSLAPGSYSLSVEQANFKKGTIENINIAAEVVQGTDVVLEAGGITETVTVEGGATTALETETGNVQKQISTAEIRDLPQAGRDPYNLLRLTPGIFGNAARSAGGQASNLPNATGPGGSNSAIFQVENQVPISANGQRVSANNFQIDGVSVNSLQFGGAAVVTPNQESVKEVLVSGTSFSAEDGRNSGAQVKVVSQQGTNDFHGSAFFKYNDPGFNAFNRFFGIPGTPRVSTPQRVENRDKQFGGSIGGPFPFLNFGEGGPVTRSGKDRSFFFFSYEGLRSSQDNTYQAFVETAQYRQQVIALRPGGTTAQIFQLPGIEPRVIGFIPRTCADVFGGAAAARCRDVAGGLDIGSLAGTRNVYLPFGPNPGQVDIGGGFDGIPDIAFANLSNPRKTIGNQYNFRIDFNVNDKNQLAFSSYFTPLDDTTADDSSRSRPSSDIRFRPLNYLLTGIYISNLSSTMVNEFRANLTRFRSDDLQLAENTNLAIPNIEVEGLPFDRIRFGRRRSETTPALFSQNTFEFSDTMTKVIGNHALRFGGLFRRELDNNSLIGGARPLLSFVGLFNLANDTPIFESVNADPRTGAPADASRFFRTSNIAGFIQDDWKARPNLTLNFGLRYEYFSPLTETQNRITNLQLGTGLNTLTGARLVGVESLSKSNRKNFAPRFGFAYSPSFGNFLGGFKDRIVIRGGAGIYYNRIPNVVFSNTRGNPPFFARYNICCGTNGSPFANGQIVYALGSSNSPSSFPTIPALGTGINPATGLPNVGDVEIYGSPENLPNAEVYKYSLELQYQMPFNIVTSVGYEGNQSRHLIRLVNLNFFYPRNAGIFAAFFPQADINASYDGLNLRAERRFAQGFQLTANYRFSKSLDTLSGEGPGAVTNQTYPIDLRQEKGPSDYDVRHYFTLSGLYELPFFRNRETLAGKLLGGIQITGILTRHTGFPWTPKIEQGLRGAGGDFFGPIRPTAYFGGVQQNTSNSSFLQQNGYFTGGGTRYFSTAVRTDATGTPTFQLNPPGIGRNSFRGPNYTSVDMSLAKRFGLPSLGVFGEEGPNLELRVNAFNIFNNLNLQQFNFFSSGTFVNRPNFGEPDGALAGRTIELQARFRF
jgi:hypothetical protein